MTSARVTIVNVLGFHARAAARFVDLAATFRSTIEIERGPDRVDGKSILGILTLAAPRGTEVRIFANGPDEREAVAALAGLIEDRFGEER